MIFLLERAILSINPIEKQKNKTIFPIELCNFILKKWT